MNLYFSLADNLVMLLNPLSADLNAMRQTLLFGGLEALRTQPQIVRIPTTMKFFEFGNLFTISMPKKRMRKPCALFGRLSLGMGNW